MFDIYKRTISMILWGINLVNMVKLADSKNNNLSDLIYIVILITLFTLLSYFLFRNFIYIKKCKPNYYGLGIIFLINILLLKFILDATFIFNPIVFIFYIIGNILLIISLFLEINL